MAPVAGETLAYLEACREFVEETLPSLLDRGLLSGESPILALGDIEEARVRFSLRWESGTPCSDEQLEDRYRQHLLA